MATRSSRKVFFSFFLLFPFFLHAQEYADASALSPFFERARAALANSAPDQAFLLADSAFMAAQTFDRQEKISAVDSFQAIALQFYRNAEVSYSRQCFERALQLLQASSDTPTEGMGKMHNNIGIMLNHEGKFGEAVKHYLRSVEIQLELNGGEETILVGKTYNNIGVAKWSQGLYDEAAAYNERALRVKKATIGEESEEYINSLMNLGGLYAELKNTEEGLEKLKETLRIAKKVLKEDDPLIAKIYNNLGGVYVNLQDYQLGIDYHQKALSIKLKDEEAVFIDIANSYRNLGAAYYSIGEVDKGLGYLQRSLDMLLNSLEPDNPELGPVYINIGNACILKEDFARAEENFQKATDILGPSNDSHLFLAEALNGLAVVNEMTNRLGQAMDLYSRALAIYRDKQGRISPDVARSLMSIADVLRKKGAFEPALETYGEAISACGVDEGAEAVPMSTRPVLLPILLAKARMLMEEPFFHNDQEKTKAAITTLRFAAKVEQDMKDAFVEDESKENLLSQSSDLYEALIRAEIMHNGARPPLHELFRYAESSKATMLYEALREAKALSFAGIPDLLTRRERRLRAAINYYEKLAYFAENTAEKPDHDLLRQYHSKLFGLKRDYQALRDTFKFLYPDYYTLRFSNEVETVGNLQAFLAPGQTLLEYVVGDSAIFAFVVRPGRYEVRQLPRGPMLEQQVKDLREGIYAYHTGNAPTARLELESARRYTSAAHALYKQLVAPVKDFLTEEVILIPDGILGYLPFEALLAEAPANPLAFGTHAYLLHNHQFSYCYSATLLREMQRRKHQRVPSGEFLAFAPYYRGDTTLLAELFAYTDAVRKGLDPLPHSGEEAYRASRLFGGDYYIGAGATAQRFNELAGNYRILHLATHGQANGRAGDYSSLAFSAIEDSQENELLYVRDLYGLQLNADLVVLSACEAGIGELQRGEGIISLARAFAYAGAKSMVTTLWLVNDARSKDLMLAFYKNLKKGRAKDEALRQAKLKLLKGGAAHPFFWAGFVAIGDMGKLD